MLKKAIYVPMPKNRFINIQKNSCFALSWTGFSLRADAQNREQFAWANIIVGPYWILGSFCHWAFSGNCLCHCRALMDLNWM